MSQQNRAFLKGKYEQGDVPQGSDYVDFIDSFPTLADTTAQSFASPINVAGALGATTVSANTIEASAGVFTQVSAASITVAALSADSALVSALSVTTVTANAIEASSISFTVGSGANFTAGLLTVTEFATAMVTASAVTGAGQTIPNQVKGFLTVQVCGASVMIPYFPVA